MNIFPYIYLMLILLLANMIFQNQMERSKCEQQGVMMGYSHYYSFGTACMVQIDGKWIASDKVHVYLVKQYDPTRSY